MMRRVVSTIEAGVGFGAAIVGVVIAATIWIIGIAAVLTLIGGRP